MDILTPGAASDRPQDDQPVVLSLSHLSESLKASSLPEAFRAILDFTMAALQVDAACIALQSRDGGPLAIVASDGMDAALIEHSPAPGEGLMRAAMSEQAPICVADLSLDTRDSLGSLFSAGYQAAVFTPILTADRSVGAVGALQRQKRDFTIPEIDILLELTGAVASVLNEGGGNWLILEVPRSGLPARARDRQDLGAVARLTDAIIAATTMDQLLDAALQQSMEAAQAATASLMLYNPRTQLLSVEASRGLSPEVLQKWGSRRLGEGLSGWVAQHEKPLLLSDVAGDPRADPRFRSVDERQEISSALIVPLRTGSRLIGVLNLAREAGEQPFDQHEADLLGTVASQIAIAIERMRLHQEIQKRSLQLSTLVEVGKTITSMLDLGVVTEQVCLQMRTLARAEMSFLFFYDPINDRVRLAGQSGNLGRQAAKLKSLADDLALASARSNRTITAQAAQAAVPRALVTELDAGGWTAVPFRHRGHRIAVGVVAPARGKAFDPDVGELLEQFGSLAAVAVQNARIYNREHAIARVMQGAVISTSPLAMEGLEIAHRLVPQHEVGGDYYDFITLGDGRLGVVMADVSGSSLRAATYTTLGKHALRAYAREYESPAEVLSRLNRLVCEEAAAEIFISVFYGLIDLNRSEITYAMAGHEPALLRRASDRRIRKLQAPGMLLGVSTSIEFESRRQPFHPGDLLTLYTDGLTEAPVNKRRF
ncbi:MAG: GAF domain-containing protein, partial [Armatimonadetes bacterium]|nr:GAF domain-containing protein [Armatimonadota bacterium]